MRVRSRMKKFHSLEDTEGINFRENLNGTLGKLFKKTKCCATVKLRGWARAKKIFLRIRIFACERKEREDKRMRVGVREQEAKERRRVSTSVSSRLGPWIEDSADSGHRGRGIRDRVGGTKENLPEVRQSPCVHTPNLFFHLFNPPRLYFLPAFFLPTVLPNNPESRNFYFCPFVVQQKKKINNLFTWLKKFQKIFMLFDSNREQSKIFRGTCGHPTHYRHADNSQPRRNLDW